MENYLKSLRICFQENANPSIAAGQKAYMRGKFDYFGIKTPLRREIQKPFWSKNNIPKKEMLGDTIRTFWHQPERDFQLFAQELILKYKKDFTENDLDIVEFMITHKSWWDTVDHIAIHVVGYLFQKYPALILPTVTRWLASGNIWLQRSCLLFQRNYKSEMDTSLLAEVIEKLNGTNEFFINKAIGWMLREYGKFDPAWVRQFVDDHELSKLSRQEALRLIR